jgi:hypothetical protein
MNFKYNIINWIGLQDFFTKFTGTPHDFDGKNRGFPVKISPSVQ